MNAAPRASAPKSSTRSQGQATNGKPKREADILFQTYFKSVGPRTYAAQLKEAGNGNHFLVLTEGKRDESNGEVRKTRLYVFSEDFPEFFKMMHNVATFIRENPVPADAKEKRARFWAKQNAKPPATPSKAASDAPQKRRD
jgi:hypothetical protein